MKIRTVTLLFAVLFFVFSMARSETNNESNNEKQLWSKQFENLQILLSDMSTKTIDCNFDYAIWNSVILNWGNLYAFQIGPLENPEYNMGIMLWPDRKGFVFRAVKSYQQNSKIEFKDLSIAVRGLTALDHIFDKSTSQAKYCELAQSIISDLIRKTELAKQYNVRDFYADISAYERAQHRSMVSTIVWINEVLLPSYQTDKKFLSPFSRTNASAEFLIGIIQGLRNQFDYYWKKGLLIKKPSTAKKVEEIFIEMNRIASDSNTQLSKRVNNVSPLIKEFESIWTSEISSESFIGFNSKDGD